MSTPKNNPKMIRTHKGNLFINFYNFFFYMTEAGERFFSKGELDTADLPNSAEWSWAQKKWDNAKVEDLTEELQKKASELHKKISRNKFYGANEQQLKQMQKAVKNRKAPGEMALEAIRKAGGVRSDKHIASNRIGDFTPKK